MPRTVISVENLSKYYRLGVIGGATLREDVSRWWARTRNKPDPYARIGQKNGAERGDIWALKDINLEVREGEILGVIGRNGAGKSTLLKILSRITAPTSGRAIIRGRIGSLLEVGTGFHPELSGRENIFLNGAILGMSKAEVARKLDEIVAFAEMEKFIDTPVKRYSSGMTVRLAFAVAAHLEPEILIVDEVLAVGDAEFQKKCLGKMGDVASRGRTILFVSHNMSSIKTLCSSGLLLKGGVVVNAGPIETVIESYTSEATSLTNERLYPASGCQSDLAYVQRVAVKPVFGLQGSRLEGTKPIEVVVDVQVLESAKIDVFIHCYSELQTMVFSSSSFFEHDIYEDHLALGKYRFECEIPGYLLNDGSYTLDVMLIRNRKEVFYTEPSVLRFRIEDDFPSIAGWEWRPAGVIRPKLKWSCNLLEEFSV